MALPPHPLSDRAPYRRSETVLAHSMLATTQDNSITLFDKIFYRADLLLTLN